MAYQNKHKPACKNNNSLRLHCEKFFYILTLNVELWDILKIFISVKEETILIFICFFYCSLNFFIDLQACDVNKCL